MSDDLRTAAPERPLRADARRSIDRIVTAARALVEEQGPAVSLDEVAKRAGVAPATLYRHFPSRMHLFETVYRSRMLTVLERAPELSSGHEPMDALLLWLHEFIDFSIESHRVLTVLLSQGLQETDPSANAQWGRAQVVPVVARLLQPAQRAGGIRGDLTADELVALVTGLTFAVDFREGRPDVRRAGALRTMELLIDGLAPR
ncbi:TetR/AcrR family transcriptional regulator [Lentzea cavernae]|uniref:TetR/AcrR family transcriptional regulator n=1 Tax=Lentzea cavernae TaxID=2020703 RepID=UPI00174B4BB2|nr:TetR/AcrR family transcriptional regulator [Lentzea cavernae]